MHLSGACSGGAEAALWGATPVGDLTPAPSVADSGSGWPTGSRESRAYRDKQRSRYCPVVTELGTVGYGCLVSAAAGGLACSRVIRVIAGSLMWSGGISGVT